MPRARRYEPEPAPRPIPASAPAFFVPHADSAEQAEGVRDATIAFMRTNGFDVLDQERVYCLSYTHNGKRVVDVVGELDRYSQETILVILRTPVPGPSLVCTANAGVLRGHPIVAPGDAHAIPFAGTTLQERRS